VKGNNEDLTAMIRMRWNLFRGKHDEARREETALLINEAKEIRNNAIRQAEEGVRLSWASYQSTKAQLAFLEKHMAASKQTRKAYAKQFDIGQRSLLDLLDTENEVFESSKAFLTAEYTNQFAQYRILAGMGKLLDSLEVGSPAESMPLAQAE
jgi:adhesin transport system outer membrane protein